MKYTTRARDGKLYEGAIEQASNERNDLIFTFDINEFDPNKLLTIIGKEFAGPIKKWLFLNYDDNVTEEEGGFDSWWGMNSFPMYELGLKFIFEYERDYVTLTIKTGGY